MNDLEYQLELLKKLELTSEDNVKSAYRVLSARFREAQVVLLEAQKVLENSKVVILAQAEEIKNLQQNEAHLNEIIEDLMDKKATF
jgi:urease accessory protein UreE